MFRTYSPELQEIAAKEEVFEEVDNKIYRKFFKGQGIPLVEYIKQWGVPEELKELEPETVKELEVEVVKVVEEPPIDESKIVKKPTKK